MAARGIELQALGEGGRQEVVADDLGALDHAQQRGGVGDGDAGHVRPAGGFCMGAQGA